MQWIILGVFLIIVISGFCLYIKVKRGIQEFSRQAFGTSDIAAGIRMNEQRIASTPKSISGGDSMFIDKIKADFPEFNLDNAKNTIITKLKSPDKSIFIDADTKVVLQQGSGLKVHKIAISGYEKSYNDASIKFQASYEVIRHDQKEQCRAEIVYSYALDSNEVLKCPHCGAPVRKLGTKVCEFCGHGVLYDLDSTWKVLSIKNI